MEEAGTDPAHGQGFENVGLVLHPGLRTGRGPGERSELSVTRGDPGQAAAEPELGGITGAAVGLGEVDALVA